MTKFTQTIDLILVIISLGWVIKAWVTLNQALNSEIYAWTPLTQVLIVNTQI